MVQKEILKEIESSKIFKTKGAPKFVCMHFTSTSVLTANKKSKIFKTGEDTPIKLGPHAFHINLYLHEFFEPILFFDPMDNNVHGLKVKFEG